VSDCKALKLLVVKTKHFTSYIDASEDKGKAFLAAFHILDENESYGNLDEDERPSDDYIPENIKNSVDPDRIAKREELTRDYKRRVAEWEEQRMLYIKAKAEEQAAAYTLLLKRKYYEYEEWSLEDLEKP
jgi:hypothetical protein